MIHRDLKLDNILLNKTESGYHVKIADFGSSVICKKGDKVEDSRGSIFYIAREVVFN